MRSFEFSHARLGLNEIDILYVHDLEIPTLGVEGYRHHFPIFMDGGLRALDELKSTGAIRAYGLGVNDVQVCLDVVRSAPLDVILLAGRYTLLDRTAEKELLPLCERSGTSLVIGGVFNSGILATGAVPGAHYNYVPATPEITDRVNEMDRIAGANGASLAATALRFPFRHPSVTSILIGTAKPSSLSRNVQLLDVDIGEGAWAEMDAKAIR